tara:strand:- start:2403 stop:2720 length:318 start_codon:yes stop_codon:yes gene_type:complete
MKESDYLLKRGLSMLAVQELLIDGFTLPQIAKKYNIHPETLCRVYKPVKKNFKYIDTRAKVKPNESDNISINIAPFDRIYTWDRLSKSEIQAYYNYESKNKAYYE